MTFRAIPFLLAVLSALAMVNFTARTADATRVGDITRLSNDRTNKLQGLGLVIGLKGTGDGGDYQPAIRPLAETLAKFSNAASVAELSKVKNVALVQIEAEIPVNARAGDKFDVKVASMGSASSLKGGRLFICPMMGPIPTGEVFALASGPVVLEDPSTPTTGIVRNGGQMETDIPVEMIDPGGRFTLVIDGPSASWATASMIATVINGEEDGSTWAVAIDPKNVVVTIPPSQREAPDIFIARVQGMPMPRVPVEARVTINDRTGTMILTGDVTISPVIITHNGLTISTRLPAVQPTERTPVIKSEEWLKLDPDAAGGAKLQDLLSALDQLKVPAADKISIVQQLHKTGKLHAKLIVE